jgi:drug/metabolite transporter (DMT)-like permease
MRQLGIIQVLLSGFCFGFLGLFGKQAYALGLKPGEFLSLRFLIASALLGAFLLLTNPRSLRVSQGELRRCLGLGAFGYAVFSSCFFFALEGLSASLTVLLLYTYPVIVSVGAWVIFRERLSRWECLALPLVAVGLGLLVWGEFEVRSAGALAFGFLSALFYSAYIMASSRFTRGIPPFTAIFYIMLSAGVVLSLVHLRRMPPSIEAWGVVVSAAFLCSVLAMGLFLAALQKLKNSEVSLLSTAEPVTGVILAAIFLGERLLPPQWVGGALIVAGMVLVGYSKAKQPQFKGA